MENMDKAKAVAENVYLTVDQTVLKCVESTQNELLVEEIAKRWNAYRKLIEFLMGIENVFSLSICATPTGALRNELTERNIERMELISSASTTVLYSAKLHKLLDKLTAIGNKINDMDSNDINLGAARYAQDQLVDELIKLTRG